MPQEANIVKQTCKELGMTYKELGEAIGYGEGTLKVSVSNNKVSTQITKAIQLYKENLTLKQEITKSNLIKSTLKEWLE